MAAVAVSLLMEPLIWTIEKWLKDEISLIKDVKLKLRHVSSKLKTIQNVLDDAEQRSVKEEAVQGWLDVLKDISYEMDDVLDKWNTSISKRGFAEADNNQISSSSCLLSTCVTPFKKFGLHRNLALRINDIDDRLELVIKEMDDFKFVLNQKSSNDSLRTDRITTSIIKESETYGRAFDEKTILSRLLSESSDEVYKKIPIISIVGVGGLGKTTLAKLVFNNDEVVKRFTKRIWVCVSDPFDMYVVGREIIEAIDGIPPNESSPDLLLQHLKNSVSKVKFLLILDDVWDEEGRKWADLKNCLDNCMAGSRIVVTTRKENVAKVMGTSITNMHNLEKLSEEACWSLFDQIAFDDKVKKENEMLTIIGREIVKRCKGLPLTVRTLGNVLRLKNTIEEWEYVLHSEIWKIEKVDVELFPHLYLSYNELPSAIKRCFTYCSIFPKDSTIDVGMLIKVWMAQGYVSSTNEEMDMEVKGREYFDRLGTSCFFQEFERDVTGKIVRCKMHDIVHNFASYLTRNESIIIKSTIHNSFFVKARHIRLLPSIQIYSPLTVCDMGTLRSFLIDCDSSSQLLFIPFSHLKCVRVLVLSRCKLTKVRKEVMSLVHLRYLDLSYNKDLDELSEYICELYNLQTLNINCCYALKRLPQMIGKLVNLRHFFADDLRSLQEYPKSFERLTNLRTLSNFRVGRKYCRLEHLNKCKHLGGKLSISIDSSDLEVTDLVADAKKAQLKNKIYIQQLVLMVVIDGAGVEEAWEALLPPPYLCELTIVNFNGIQYPSWLTNNSHFNNLKELNISRFAPTCLPSGLCKLPNLELLCVFFNKYIRHLGHVFLGIGQTVSSGTRPSSSSILAFPKLIRLVIGYLINWEVREDLNDQDHDTSGCIQIMPQLEELILYECTKLQRLPHRLLRKASSLKSVKIERCGILQCHRQELVEILLSHIPKIQVDDVLFMLDNPNGTPS